MQSIYMGVSTFVKVHTPQFHNYQVFKPENVELILFEAIDPESVPFLESDLVTASDVVASILPSRGVGHKKREAERLSHHYHRDESIRHHHEESLIAHAEALTAAGYTIKAKAEIGDAFEQILTYARTAGIDLIAMATHGRSGFSKLVLGSVAERVVHESPVPVLVVRPEKPPENQL